MKSHTSEFKEEIKTLGKQQSVRITYTSNNEQIILTNEDINSATPNYEASLLKSVMKVLELDSNVSIPKNTEIKFEYGLLVNGEYEYLDYGNYIVAKEPEKQEDTLSYKITCYDKMLYSMKDYEHVDITYPCTIKQYLVALCNKIGLQFKDSDFANANRQITSELFMTINEDGTYSSMGYTYRDVLDQIAETTGGCICLTLDDKVEVRYINKLLEYSTSKNTNEVEIETQVKEKVKTINIDGNSYQETTEGYNIANLDRGTFTLAGVTVTNNGDGSLTFNGTSKSAEDLILTKARALNSNIYQFEDAKYLLKTFVISGSISNPDNKVARITCMGRSNNTDNYGMLYNTLTQNIFSELFTMKTTDTLGRIELYINSSGITFNNYTIKILLAKTDNVNLPYEPYTGKMPYPSPDYPQNIEVINGVNLFDKNKVTTGWLNKSGNIESTINYRTSDFIKVEEGKNYYIPARETTRTKYYKSDKSVYSNTWDVNDKEQVITIPNGVKYIRMSILITGSSAIDINTFQFVEGTTKKPYIPYGCIGLQQSGKNLLNVPEVLEISIFKEIEVNLEANNTYTFKFDNAIAGSDNNISRIAFRNTKDVVVKNLNTLTVKNFEIQPTQDITNIRIYASADYSSSVGKTKTFQKLMIYEGTEETPYEPYHEPIITPINLQGNILSKVGEVKDILKVNRNGEVEIKKNTWEETINTSDLITLSNNNKALVFYPSKKKTASTRDDNYLVTNAQRNTSHNDGTVYQNLVNFVFVGSPTDTLETIKAKFNGGKILYQLATPQIITLPSISPIELWQGTNIFSLVTNLDTEIELEYPTNYDTIDEEYINDTNVNFGEKYRAY